MQALRNFCQRNLHSETPVKGRNYRRGRLPVKDETSVRNLGTRGCPFCPIRGLRGFLAFFISISFPFIKADCTPYGSQRLRLYSSQFFFYVCFLEQRGVKPGISPELGSICGITIQKSQTLCIVKHFRLPMEIGNPVSLGIFREKPAFESRDLLRACDE